jgi:hypothetical protein
MRSGLTTEKEKRMVRHSGMDSRNPGFKDGCGDIHVGLDSSIPCWNDAIENFCISAPSRLRPSVFKGAIP